MRIFAVHFAYRPAQTLDLEWWEVPYLLRAARIRMRDLWIHTASLSAAIYNSGARGPKQAVQPRQLMPRGLSESEKGRVPKDWRERFKQKMEKQ